MPRNRMPSGSMITSPTFVFGRPTKPTKSRRESREGTFLQRVATFLSTQAAESALTQCLTALRRSGPQLLGAATRFLTMLSNPPGKTAVTNAKQPSHESSLTTAKQQLTAAKEAKRQAERAELAAEHAQLRAELAEERARNKEQAIRTELIALMREGYGAPASLDDEVKFCLSLSDDKQAQFVELKKQMGRSWLPGRLSEPRAKKTMGEGERALLREKAGIAKKGTAEP